MHADRERLVDFTYYLECTVCDLATYHRLGGETRKAASLGGPVKTRCFGDCGAETVHEVVRG